MTNRQRQKAARRFRELMDNGVHRKEAVLKVRTELGVPRTSLYRYCKRFGVSTK